MNQRHRAGARGNRPGGRRPASTPGARLGALLVAGALVLAGCSGAAKGPAKPAAAQGSAAGGTGPAAGSSTTGRATAGRAQSTSTGAGPGRASTPASASGHGGGATAGSSAKPSAGKGGTSPAPAAALAGAEDVGSAPAGSLDLSVCVPFRQVLQFEAQWEVLATQSHQEQQTANQTLRSATARMAKLLGGTAPAPVTAAIADLARDSIVVTPTPQPGGAAHPAADVLALRQYLALNCGGEPGTVAQEAAIRKAVAGWLPGAGIKGNCIRLADIRVSHVDASYATADLVQSCHEPGGGTVLLHRSGGAWKVLRSVLAVPIPPSEAPAAVVADLFGPGVAALGSTAPTGQASVGGTAIDQAGANYRVTGTYPQVAGLHGGQAQATINAALKQAASGAVAAFQRALPAAGGTLRLSQAVTFQNPTYLSVQMLIATDVNGTAHPTGRVEAFTFDLQSGYRYHLADLFRPGADYARYVETVARSQIDARYGKGTWHAIAAQGASNLLSTWNLTPKGIEITFNDAPAALAVPSAVVPYTDPVLASLARPSMLPQG